MTQKEAIKKCLSHNALGNMLICRCGGHVKTKTFLGEAKPHWVNKTTRQVKYRNPKKQNWVKCPFIK